MGAAAEAFDAPTPYGSLSYHRIGRNPPVIFGPAGAFYPVAGLLAFPATANLIRGIAAYASGVLFDRRGLGWSDPLPEDRPPSLDNQVEDMVRVLDHAKVEQAYVWAVGFDAQPALAFAARHPSRTAGVLALGTT
ncbi:MAG: alpha/beta fold hydrolase, partial [Mycobacteriales bacterium]